jgi:FkbM family methyltransferase
MENRLVGFVTYAQNFEDVMLWRALQGVPGGFYIDVGAADPEEDSVSRVFYDHDWHGVNIEPSPDHFAVLAAARPRDINLCCLVGAEPGEMDLYNIPDTGLSTVKRDFANRQAADGRPLEVIGVAVRTLADICREYAPPDIHFLKIDVEGAEEDALRGADFITYRPWIVVVEATRPMSQEENWQSWDPLLTEADYQFVWFDGLNRFYLAAERADALRHAFRTPPNVFDGWIRPRGQQQMAVLERARGVHEAMARLHEETASTRKALDAEAHSSRVEAGAARTEASVARQEAAVSRAEMVTLRMALEAAQDETGSARAEAGALREALETAQHETGVARAEADALRKALETAQHETDSARAEAAALRESLNATLQDERARLSAATQAHEQAEAWVAALLASTSWRITAPVRGVSGLLATKPARRHRLGLVARVGQGPGDAKGPARVAMYGLGRAAARAPGGRALARVAAAALPGPYRWLYTRYVIYRNIAAPGTGSAGDQPAVSEQPPASLPAVDFGLSAEEQAMLLRLRAGNNTSIDGGRHFDRDVVE